MILEGISHFIWKLAPPGHECDIIPPTLTTLTTVWYYSTHQLEHLNIDIIPPTLTTLTTVWYYCTHQLEHLNIDIIPPNTYFNICTQHLTIWTVTKILMLWYAMYILTLMLFNPILQIMLILINPVVQCMLILWYPLIISTLIWFHPSVQWYFTLVWKNFRHKINMCS